MNPDTLDLYVTRGGTLALEVELVDEDDVPVPFPQGWSGKAQVRPGAGDPTLLLDLTVVLQDPGVIVISATDEATAAIPAEPNRGRWDCFLFDDAGNSWPILAGEAFVRGRVTVP